MMHMTFYWSRYVTLLFNSWKTDSWPSYALTLLACIIASVFYQFVEDLRIRFKLLSVKNASPPSETEVPLMESNKSRSKKFPAAKFAGAAFFGVNSAIGYMLMLAVMSFNGGVFVAIVVGLSIGYLVFRSDGDEDLTVVVDSPCACA